MDVTHVPVYAIRYRTYAGLSKFTIMCGVHDLTHFKQDYPENNCVY